MVYLGKLDTPLTARLILDKVLQSKAPKECSGWFIGKCLDTLFGDSKYLTQLESMNKIDKELSKLKQDTPTALGIRTDWQHLNTRLFYAEIGLCHKYQLMQTIMSNRNSMERRHEAIELRKGILDSNNGVLNNLSIIHQVLVGRTALNNTGKGLLEMWSEGIYDNMKINPMSAKICQDYVDVYMTKAAIIQLKGILLFTSASTNSCFCMHQYDLFKNNLKSQIETMENTVPSHMKYLSIPDKKNVFVMRPVLGGDFEPFVRRQCQGTTLSNEYFDEIGEDGKWYFETSESFKNDGSLLISGVSHINGQTYYIGESKSNKAEFVLEKCKATPFCVIPLDFDDRKMKALICTLECNNRRYLGNRLTFINDQDFSKFTLSFDNV